MLPAGVVARESKRIIKPAAIAAAGK